MSELADTGPLMPLPAQLEIQVGGKNYSVTYEQAFMHAFALIDKQQFESAARLFEHLERFADRGPRAYIMQAFCEAAALHCDNCSKPLTATFDGKKRSLAADLHNVFISYHIGIRQDAITAMVEIVNKNRELPILCLLLGDMFRATGNIDLARKCWSLAVRRDHPNGAVALVASKHIHGASKN